MRGGGREEERERDVRTGEERTKGRKTECESGGGREGERERD